MANVHVWALVSVPLPLLCIDLSTWLLSHLVWLVFDSYRSRLCVFCTCGWSLVPPCNRKKKERKKEKKKKKKFTWRSLKMSWFQAVGITFFYCCKSNKLLFIGLANDARDLLLFEFGVWALWAILTPFYFIYIFSGWGLTSPFHLDGST